MNRLLPRAAIAALSGLGMMLVCPPIGLRHLLWVIFVPALLVMRPGEHRNNALIGYAAGWTMLAANFFWLADTVVIFSSLPYIASVLVVVIFATFFALPYLLVFGSARWLREHIGVWWVVVVPGLQVAAEHLIPSLFPYYLGGTMYRDPYIWQVASLTGPTGLTFLALVSNCLIVEGMLRFRSGQSQPILAVAALLATIGAGFGFGAWRRTAVEAQLADAPTIRASILQQSEDMEFRLRESVWDTLSDWVLLTREVIADKPDLVVWPEGSVLFNPDDDRVYNALGGRSPKQFFGELVTRGGFDFLIGGGTIELHEGTTADGRQRFTAYNSCYGFRRDGAVVGRYDKMVPLPFGEYLPLADTFPILREIIQGPGNFRAGTEAVTFSASSGDGQVRYTYTTPICYEAILSGQMWRMRDADLLLNITNDAWFGDTAAPHLHGMLSAAQAVTLGRPMLRIAYTGVSFVVEPHGQILYETEPFAEVAEVVEVRLGAVQTGYRSGGFLFPWIAALVGFSGLIVGRRRSREAR
ncbi:MAG: apolipoprotein N-acyltransferase [Myxococcota bacterium]